MRYNTYQHYRGSNSGTPLLSVAMLCLAVTLWGCGSGIAHIATVAAASTPANPGTLVASTNSVSFGTVYAGQTATSTVAVTNNGQAPLEISQVGLTGPSFSIGNQSALPATIGAGGSYSLSVQFHPTAAGPAAGQLTLTSNSSTGTAAVITLSGTGQLTSSSTGTSPGSFSYTASQTVSTLQPANPSAPVTDEFFGMTVANLAPNSLEPEAGMTPFPAYPISTFRFWDVDYWAMIESYQGQQNWTKMDNSIAIAQQNGVQDFIFTFGRVPTWASTNPTDPCTGGEGPGSCAPPDMTAFDNFTTQVVQRYCGKVKYYEPWNEPNSTQFWDGTNAQLLTIVQHVSQIVKDPANCGCNTDGSSCSPNGGTNPNKVLLPPISNLSPTSLAWLESFLAAAGAQYPYADIAAFHGYAGEGAQPETIVPEVQLLRQTLANHGLSNLELWNTEVSWEENANLTQQQQASWLMRYLVTQAALNIPRVVWYSYDNCSWGTLWSSPLCANSPDPPGQLTPAGIAYGTIADWLLGASLTNCQQFENGLWICALQRSGGTQAWILWNSTGTSLSVPVPENMGLTTYRDWQNNLNPLPAEISVNQLPILVE